MIKEKRIRGSNYNNVHYAEDKGNAIEFEVDSRTDDVGAEYYGSCWRLKNTFQSEGRFKVTIVFTPDEVQDAKES